MISGRLCAIPSPRRSALSDKYTRDVAVLKKLGENRQRRYPRDFAFPFGTELIRGDKAVTYECQFAETVHLRGHNNDMIDAYLARPLGSGPYPGVVVIHHMPGWDEAHKEIGRRFAHHGYVTIVPNLQFRE